MEDIIRDIAGTPAKIQELQEQIAELRKQINELLVHKEEDSAMTVQKAANYLDVSESLVRQWIRQGRLKAFQPDAGGVVRIMKSEVTRFINSNRA